MPTRDHNGHEDARRAVHNAVRRGALTKKPCLRCGFDEDARLIEAHHYRGYDREHWLDVQWLCSRCHAEVDELRRRWMDIRVRAILKYDSEKQSVVEANAQFVDSLWNSLPEPPWDLSDSKVTRILDELAYWGEGFVEGSDAPLPDHLLDYEGFMDRHPEVYDGAEGFFAPDPRDFDFDWDAALQKKTSR